MGLSRRAYARYRSVSEMTVRKAIAAGRIILGPDGTIDLAKANWEWRASTDPAWQRKAAAPKPNAQLASAEPVPSGALEAIGEAIGEPTGKPGANVTILRARTANEVIKPQEGDVRLAKIKGELVDRARAVATIFGLTRRERDAWVQWLAREAALMAADLNVDPDQMELVQEKQVRRHLAELTDIKVELR